MAGSGHRRDKRSRSRSQPGLGRLAEVVNSASGPDLFFFRGRRSGGLRLVRLYGSFTQCGASQPVAKVKMLKKLLSKPKSKKKKEAASSALPTLDRLHEKKKLYETQIEQLANFQLRVHDQIIMLESAKATTDTVDALRSGSSAVKAIHQSVSIDDIENAIEEANEHTENMRQIQEALATPIGASADFDEDELEAELEDLEEEELENDLPEPPQRTSMEPSARVTTTQPANDLAELTKLQAEMAL
uniref:Charged multivesicular body protein 4b n=1 Tax=Oryza nivara TaxID=4536 RepID=A0A0E0J643_ORYNI